MMKTTAVITCMMEGDLPYVRTAIQSAINQTVPCKVLVLINEAEGRFAPLVNNMPSGVTAHSVALEPAGTIRNIGARMAETDWIAFLDGDDVWLPHKNQRQLQYAAKSGKTAIGCRHILVREDGKPFFFAPTLSMPLPSGMMFKRDLLLAQPFLPIVWEDAELWKRPAVQSEAEIMHDFLYHYRVRRHSSSTSWSPAKRRKLLFANLSHLPLLRVPLLFASRACAHFAAP